jgi:16S rRNA (guanine527-N7)-methyltransferase
MTPAALLADGVAALGLAAQVASEVQSKLLSYLFLLDKWNRTHNLTAIREPERMVTHHLLDSLAVLSHLPSRAGLRIVDVGSGGGLPGIPLAIVRPDWDVTLLDSNFKKATFLRQAAIELPLANVHVAATRVENYAPAHPFDIAISRAFSDLAVFANATGSLLAPDGRLVAMKGVYPHEELAHLPPGIGVTRTPMLRIPGLDGDRHLVIMKRAA